MVNRVFSSFEIKVGVFLPDMMISHSSQVGGPIGVISNMSDIDVASSAGINNPICKKSWAKVKALRATVFPPVLGPEIIKP